MAAAADRWDQFCLGYGRSDGHECVVAFRA